MPEEAARWGYEIADSADPEFIQASQPDVAPMLAGYQRRLTLETANRT